MSKKYEPFGKYVLLEKLATGGMAEVYLAKSESAEGISKFIAIKRILPQYFDQREFIDMFKDEAKIAINLNHSNIVSIYEFGVEANQFFLVMDYVEGRNIRQVLNKMKKAKRTFAIEQIAYIIKEVAAGLDHAHRCLDGATGRPLNITHRDISPQNIMLSFEGEVKVVDFGIAKAESKLESTRAGTLKGKFSYMSPEQASGQPLDLRTDIFSLGIVFWELLANERLFAASNEINTLRKVKECKIPSLRAMNPNIPAELEQIVGKSLAKDRSLRYQTAATMYRDLNRFLNRHYPDFSAHDFSSFIKSLYSDEIIEHRKKMMEHAQVRMSDLREATPPSVAPAPVAPASSQRPPPLIHQPIEPSQSFFVFDGSDEDGNLELASESDRNLNKSSAQSQTENRESLGVQSPPSFSDYEIQAIKRASRESSIGIQPRVDYDNRSASFQRSHTNHSLKAKKRSNTLPILLMITALGLGFYLKDRFSGEDGTPGTISFSSILSIFNGDPKPPNSPYPAPPDWLYTLHVQSTPSGADIYINGQKSGQATPAVVKVPVNKQFKLTLVMEGYEKFERNFKQDRATASFRAQLSLQAAPPPQKSAQAVGYVKVNIPIGAKRLIINGQSYDYKPKRRYRVPANVPLTVEAIGLAGGRDAQTITVKPDSVRDITLNPNASPRR